MAEDYNTQVVNVTKKLLETLKVPHTKKGIKTKLLNHPFYPSLLSISDTINKYNIKNKALKVIPKQLDELPTPFYAFIKIESINTEDFVNVIEVTSEHVKYFHNGIQKVSRDEFIETWEEGIVLLVEKNNESKEEDFIYNKKNERKRIFKNILMSLGLGLIISVLIYNSVSSIFNKLPIVLYLITNFIGLSISILLLVFEVDKSNKFVKNICTSGFKTNCESVLTSKGSKILGISWSEIGFYYFSSTFFLLILPILSLNQKVSFLSIIGFVSALYIPFSITYQYFVVKQWCKLCLLIQATLLMQFIWIFNYGDFQFDNFFTSLFYFSLIGLAPIILWNFIRPFIVKSKDLEIVDSEYKRIIARQDIFEQSIADQKILLDGWQDFGIIIKGNPLAQNTILKVCSPSCSHCSKAHDIFNRLISNNKNLKIVTIYGLNNDKEDDRRLPVRYFLALAELKEYKILEKAMDYWYLSDKPNLKKLYSFLLIEDEIIKKQETLIDKMVIWTKDAEINYTPTVFWNGRKLPASYNLDDLLNLHIS